MQTPLAKPWKRCLPATRLAGWWLLAALLLPAFWGKAQPANTSLNPAKQLGQYVLDVWGPNDGLPSRTLIGIMHDAKGYLWLTSYNGLYRFDGIEFRQYTSKEYRLLEKNIFGYVADHGDRLYIGAGPKGLLYYEKGEVKEEGTSASTFLKQVQDLLFMPDGRKLIATRGAGAYLQDADGRISPYKPTPWLIDITVQDIHRDRQGRTWFSTEGNGLVVQDAQGNFRRYTEADGLLDDMVSRVHEDAEGRIWVATGAGVNVVSTSGQLEVLEGTQGYPCNQVYADGYGSLWIATRKGLLRKNALTGAIERLDERDGLPHRDVSGLVEDEEGSIWIATYQAGLARIKDSQFTNYTTRNGLSAKGVSTVCLLDSQRLLLATASGSMHLVSEGRISDFKPQTTLEGSRIKHLMRDSQGRVLIASYGGLLMIYPDGREVLHTKATGLPDERTRLSFEDSKGNIWIGTRAGGVIRIDARTGEYSVLNKANGLASDFIMSIDEGPKGEIIVGTNDNGVSICHPDGRIQHLWVENGLSSNLIFNILTEPDGSMWVCSSVGLTYWQPDGQAWSLTESNGLAANAVFDVLDDGAGGLWLPSSVGLMSMEKETALAAMKGGSFYEDVSLYTEADGMPANECMGATTSLWMPDGSLSIPTLGGLAIFNPRIRIDNDRPPPVYIDEIRADGVRHQPHEQLALPADVKRVAFHYTALSLLAPKNVRFRYRLEGYDQDWVDAGNERLAVYTGLPPGEHVFRVIASNGHGVWNEEGATYVFYRTPYLYERWWFYVLLLGLLLGGTYLVYVYRTASIKRRNLELADTVARRTQEITKQKNKLELAYNDLNVVSKIGQEVSAILGVDQLIDTVHRRVKGLMSADMFGIGILREEQRHIEFRNLIRDGKQLPSHIEKLDDAFYLSVTCLMERRDILINNAREEYEHYDHYLKVMKRKPEQEMSAAIYLPLMLENKPIGVLTVQSRQAGAYSQQHLTVLRALASYISVAIDNARSYEIIEDNNHNITNSLRYAETIQEAMLPTPAALAEAFPGGHFVIYKPKDIVSGDFYWMKEVEEGVLLAVADCTGHGVPGAFMSMIGISLLNEIVAVKRITDPAGILDELHHDIQTALRQEESGNRDGMDISICLLKPLEGGGRGVVYAGAKQRLLYIDCAGELQEIRGDKRGIGGLSGQGKGGFVNQEAEMPPGTQLYLFTDGFIDQHGPSGRRMGSSHFAALLREASAMPMQGQQAHLEEALRNFQDFQHQRDDITVLGIRL